MPFNADAVHDAPRQPGVHIVFGHDGAPLFVGRSGDLRDRMLEHLRGDREASVVHAQVGATLDTDGHTADRAEIESWLHRCTVAWQVTDDPQTLRSEPVDQLDPPMNRQRPTARTGVWWVNQGRSYENESRLGVMFAGGSTNDVAHHRNVSRMSVGDVTMHYVRGAIAALSEVVTAPVKAARPYGPPLGRDAGWLTRTEYFGLDRPISLSELGPPDVSWEPFTGAGGVKQGYLYAVQADLIERLRTQFADRWPPGSPWSEQPRSYWVFQANPKQWDLVAHLPQMPAGHTESWIASRHRDQMRAGDGVLLWQGGQRDAGIHALGRIADLPRLAPRADFRPESAATEEYRVDVVVERHVVPAISRAQAQRDPVLSNLAVLRRPFAGTNLPVRREEWFAVRSLMSLDPEGTLGTWDELVRWAVRIAATVDLDAEERAYKLQIAESLATAREVLRSGDGDLLGTLRRAFGPPNNLTSWRAHGKLLDWLAAHQDLGRGTLSKLWDDDTAVGDGLAVADSALLEAAPGPGTRTNLISFLLMARDVRNLPIYRPTTFASAYRLVGWPSDGDRPPAERYDAAVEFIDEFTRRCGARDLGLRDRLDAQGLLWRTLLGEPPDSWSPDEARAYRSFLQGGTVTELSRLVELYRAERPDSDEESTRREADREDLVAGLTPDALAAPDLSLLRRLAGPAYGSPGPQPGFNALLQSEEGVTAVAETLRFLLYEPTDVTERLEACVSGDRKLPRVGEAMMVKALAVTDPDRWIPCYVSQGKVGKIAILDLLGVPATGGETAGALAATTNDTLRAVLEPHFPDDPWGMQAFTWWLLHRERVPDSPLGTLAADLYLTEEFLARIMRLTDDRGQVVLYGPPGTGKTYVALAVAGHLARGGGTVEKVQFHPSYSYEDFVEGYRPKLIDGQVTYEVVDGPLKRLAAVAEDRRDVTHVLVIDELNRANVAKVLGELLFLLEYRDESIRLQYSDTPFSLPANLKIVATMNTADRSIALVDTALRRRFHFVPFFPDTPPIGDLLRRWLTDHVPELLWVADVVDRANGLLDDRHLAIGPSHFLKRDLSEELVRLIWESSILPLVEEHYFADPSEVGRFDLDLLRREVPAPEAGTRSDEV